MTENNKIEGFHYWRIPSGEGVLYLEGAPTEEERMKNIQRTAEFRKVWQPSQTALSVYKQLKFLEGNQVIIQLWDDLMEMLPDEGPLPFSCNLLKVFTKNTKEEDRDFTQLFVEFENPKAIHNGNFGGNPIFESMINPKSGTYIYNCSLLAWMKEDLESEVKNICKFIVDKEQQIITNLDLESVFVYQFLQSEFKKGNITTNYVFQFLFRSFYRLDSAGLTKEFKAEFFKILEDLRVAKEPNFRAVDDRLAKIKDRQGRTPIQFSFITKMLNTIDDNFPIYDSEVSSMFEFKRPGYSKLRDERLVEYDYQHSKLYSSYQLILKNHLLDSSLKLFMAKFPNVKISQTKMLDFIFWQAGKLKTLIKNSPELAQAFPYTK
jgi:hypothetical protein